MDDVGRDEFRASCVSYPVWLVVIICADREPSIAMREPMDFPLYLHIAYSPPYPSPKRMYHLDNPTTRSSRRRVHSERLGSRTFSNLARQRNRVRVQRYLKYSLSPSPRHFGPISLVDNFWIPTRTRTRTARHISRRSDRRHSFIPRAATQDLDLR